MTICEHGVQINSGIKTRRLVSDLQWNYMNVPSTLNYDAEV